MNALKKTAAVLAIGGGSVVAWVAGSHLANSGFARAKEEVELTRQQLSTMQDLSAVFRNVGKVVEPSVVQIVVHKSAKTGHRALPFNDDMLRKFFPDKDKDGPPDLPEGFGDGSGAEDADAGAGRHRLRRHHGSSRAAPASSSPTTTSPAAPPI